MLNKSHVAAALTAFAVLGATAGGAFAQATTQDPKAVKAGTYKVDAYHTQVVFGLSHFGFTNFNGTFSDATGTLQYDPAKPAGAKLAISIPVESVLTPVPKLTAELKDADWFDAAKFPTATFTSTNVTPSGKNTATITGNLTLHGITKPVTLKARFIGAGTNPINKAYTIGFEATGIIKRADFGVNKYVPMVADAVNLTINGAFELQQ